jgi:hypothetical protein
MPKKNFMIRYTTLSVRVISALALAGAMLLLGGNTAWAKDCKPVHGHFINQVLVLFDGTSCTSPIGFCVSGQATGVIKGPFLATATSRTPITDPDLFPELEGTPAGTIAFVTTDLVIHTKTGDLHLKEAAASNEDPNQGDLGDVVTIVGGTGKWAGASGRLRVYGNLSPTISDVTYDGDVCLP